MIVPKYEVKPTPNKGVGIFTRQAIKKGEKIWKDDHNHYTIPAELFQKIIRYGYVVDDQIRVDLDDSIFINHSCDSNMEDSGKDCVAKRDIIPGEELTWDYTGSMIGPDSFQCKCGSENCINMIQDTELKDGRLQ